MISPASLGGVEILDVMLLMEVVRFEARLEVKLEVRLEGSVGVRGGVLRGELSTVIISGIGFIMLRWFQDIWARLQLLVSSF